MSRIASASQWLRINPDRRPEPASFPLSSRDGGEVVASANGSILRRAAWRRTSRMTRILRAQWTLKGV